MPVAPLGAGAVPGATGELPSLPLAAARRQRDPERRPEEMPRSRQEPAQGERVEEAQPGRDLREGARNHACVGLQHQLASGSVAAAGISR
ncbi:unnamed protein product [Bubo scandiacus]